MPRVSRAAIEGRLARLAQEIDAIERTRPPTLDDYLRADAETTRVALEHRIFIACQAMLDIAGHIVASLGYGAPATSREALEQLAERGIVPRSVVEGVAGAAGLRNAIAHLYVALNPAQVYEGLCKTPEMKQFAAAIWEWLERE